MNRIPLHPVARTLQIQVLRHNPFDPASAPRLQTFEVEEADAMTLLSPSTKSASGRTPPCNLTSSAAAASAAAAA